MSADGPLVMLTYGARSDPRSAGGGIFNAFLAQIVALRAMGVRVEAWVAAEEAATEAARLGASVFLDPGVHSGLAPLLSPRAWARARGLRRDGLAAAVHHSGRTWAWGTALMPGVPHAQVLHRHRAGSYLYFRNWLALSEGFAAECRARHGAWGWRRIETIPNGLRPDFPATAPTPPPCLSGGPIVIGGMGRMGRDARGFHSKGFDVLLRAAALLKARGAPVRLVLGGEPDPWFPRLAAELGVADVTTFAGHQRDAAAFMDRIDLFCLPSRIEPFGLVVIEALARGRGVIATDTHGPRDILSDGASGALVPADDPAALADALADAATPARIAAMARAARARYEAAYAPAAVGAALVGALRRIGARL